MTDDDRDALTHTRSDGTVHMVDVGEKASTKRIASAQAVVNTRPDVLRMLLAGELPKGEVLPLARVAGIMGAKQTPTLIPLCHPLLISGVEVDFEPSESSLTIVATVSTTGPTGVEMEAMTAVSVASLAVYDMIKAVDRSATITDIAVLSKSGGKSGTWHRSDVAHDLTASPNA